MYFKSKFKYVFLHFNVCLIFSYVYLPPKTGLLIPFWSTAGLVDNAISSLTLLILNNAIVAPFVQCMLHYITFICHFWFVSKISVF